MNEQSEASKICRHLDQGAERLPYRATERLAAGRAAALARLAPSASGSESPGLSSSLPAGRAGGRHSGYPTGPRPSLWWRLAATAVPLMLLAVGVVVVDTVQQEQSVAELAEVDSALLTDDLPLVAYADHGFGVYLNNTRR